jgi:hypothetical protein
VNTISDKFDPNNMPANTTDLEKRLWSAADELRANSKLKSPEYSVPVLGLIFLRHADHKFTQGKARLTSQRTALDTLRSCLNRGAKKFRREVGWPGGHDEFTIYSHQDAGFSVLFGMGLSKIKHLLYISCTIVGTLVMFAGDLRAQAACYESSIVSPSPFMGNNGEIFKLTDGSLWEVKYGYEYLYEYQPSVIICPGRGKLIIGKKSITVQLVSGVQRKGGLPKERSPQAGEWELFENTTLEGSISGTVKQGRILKATSGNVYEVTGLTLQLVLELQPEVTVLKNGDVYKLVVEGFEEPLLCKLLSPKRPTPIQAKTSSAPDSIETQIDDTFNGWDGETIFKLSNGQIWQQSSYAYTYHHAYRPKVLIYRSGSVYQMTVEGVDSTIQVKRLK